MAFQNGWRGPDIVADGLVLYLDAGSPNSYRPDFGTTWKDMSGFNNSGSLINGPTYSSANGGSIVFDGVDDYVNLQNILDNTGTSPFTISTWFKTTSTANDVQTLVSKCIISLPYTGYQLGFNTSTANTSDIGKVGIVVVSNTIEVMRKLTISTYNDGIWHNAVFTYDGSKTRTGMLLYIDGSQPSQETSDLGSIVNTISNASNYQIGARNGTNQPFYGNIANTLHYNRALSSTEVLQNYNAQKSRFGL